MTKFVNNVVKDPVPRYIKNKLNIVVKEPVLNYIKNKLNICNRLLKTTKTNPNPSSKKQLPT